MAFKKTFGFYSLINRILTDKFFIQLDSVTKDLILEDVSQYETFDPKNISESLYKTLRYSRAFRSVVLFRIQTSGNKKASRYYSLYLKFFPSAPGIEITGDIEGGLRIIHNCCTVNVAHAGKNLSVGAFAVIGKHKGKSPVIGNNVRICANSTVIGDIHIGDGALIGAASFVNKDVEPYETVAGNPARVISKNNNKESGLDH